MEPVGTPDHDGRLDSELPQTFPRFGLAAVVLLPVDIDPCSPAGQTVGRLPTPLSAWEHSEEEGTPLASSPLAQLGQLRVQLFPRIEPATVLPVGCTVQPIG